MKQYSSKLRALEFATFRTRPEFSKPSCERVVAAVSGGADSVALLLVLNALKSRAGFSLEVVHVHHGPAKNAVQTRFRNRAANHVEKIAIEMGLPFTLLMTKTKGHSEEAARDARFEVLKLHALKTRAAFIAMGHHADDLFETRLIRLIRGTGPHGLKSMSTVSGDTVGGAKIWRPFLQTSRAAIRSYLTECGQLKSKDWLEDPSNRDARYLRNSIRRQLIPALEKIRPGAAQAMARSLENIALSFESWPREAGAADSTLDRAELLGLSLLARRDRFAGWLVARRIRGISRAQIDEILKRIDTPRKRLSFTIGGRVWRVDDKIHDPAQGTSKS